ncbi:uncharacterized protein M6B38_187280 [Iris pallida]|uniref:Uncharacterized protein n=1 Tax=Iris pallida TaxID=29817 RepID=A0AAX6EJR1_IRIPA|nr:uncharacterized protein M6B38_187280 [Iris pallida]
MDEVATIYSEILECLRTESKHSITELSIVADQQLRRAEGIARAICDRILKGFFFFFSFFTSF